MLDAQSAVTLIIESLHMRILLSALFLIFSIQHIYATDLVAQGKALIELNCASCHAITKTDKSQHPDAPAFRILSQRYPIDALAEAFAEGIYAGHPDMPEFQATPAQIDAILAYIDSIQLN